MTPSIRTLRGPIVAVGLAVLLGGAAAAPTDEPCKRMLDDPLAFTGVETLPNDGADADEIVIGLFSPDDDDHPVGQAMVRGATLAVDRANAGGGIGGRPVRLVRRWADDPWGAGSKEVVKLVFEDRAWALIGGPDGASTHVAEQVATKAYIVLIAPVSSDPSLTHTRVPWIFRLAPDDAAQAKLLVDDGIVAGRLRRIGLVSSTDHDGRTAAAELIAALERAGRAPVFRLEVAPKLADPAGIAARVASFNPDGLVLRLPGADLRNLAAALGEIGLDCALLTPWAAGLDLRRFPLAYPGPVISVAPFEPQKTGDPCVELVRAFVARHGEEPPPTAVYGYDAAQLVIGAVRSGASGRADLRRLLARPAAIPAASGLIDWDNGGGNRGTPVLSRFAPPGRP